MMNSQILMSETNGYYKQTPMRIVAFECNIMEWSIFFPGSGIMLTYDSIGKNEEKVNIIHKSTVEENTNYTQF